MCRSARCHATRLETRTKESIHVCEYAGGKPVCEVKAMIETRTSMTGHDLWREVCAEHICWDPKDGELYLSRVNPGETLVEARSDTDVQIVRQTWV